MLLGFLMSLLHLLTLIKYTMGIPKFSFEFGGNIFEVVVPIILHSWETILELLKLFLSLWSPGTRASTGY